jgi:hypothetical protein
MSEQTRELDCCSSQDIQVAINVLHALARDSSPQAHSDLVDIAIDPLLLELCFRERESGSTQPTHALVG